MVDGEIVEEVHMTATSVGENAGKSAIPDELVDTLIKETSAKGIILFSIAADGSGISLASKFSEANGGKGLALEETIQMISALGQVKKDLARMVTEALED